jgi:4-amino-4-deoxy-L-arabinose transferase-like glycosyltransferase
VVKKTGAFWRDPVICLLVGAGLLMRLGYNLALHPDGREWSSFIIDEREYFGAAHMLAEGRGFSFFDTAMWVRPPLYVVFLALTMAWSGTSTVPVLVVQSLLGAATLLPLGLLAHKLEGSKFKAQGLEFNVSGSAAARWTVALGAAYLPFTLFAGLLLTETLFLLLFAWAFVLLIVARESVINRRGRSIVLVSLCGVLLGLATLTRATVLGFLLLAALWLFSTLREQSWRRRLAVAGILLVSFGACLLPWTFRNYQAYGRFVAVDTTSGYNLWLGSVGVRDEERLQADLRPISNPAERQSFAFARAWENISADPGAFASKGFKESLDLWRPLFSAEERQVRGYALGRVPAWHLASLLLLDDLLYVLVLLLAVLGLALSSPHPLKALTWLWVLLWVVLSFVFFAVTRFRLPVVAALLPWAGVGLSLLFRGRDLLHHLRRLPPQVKLASIAAAVTLLIVTVPAVSLADTLLGVERWAQQASYRRGEELLKSGKADEAISEYKQSNLELTDTRYSLAAAYLQTGQAQLALDTLRADEPENRFEPPILRGEAARQSGDLQAARSFFNSRVVQVADDAALRWAWDHLRPPPVDSISLGSGLDVGYVAGFYRPERDESGVQFRWAGERPMIRGLRSPSLQIEWSGWRPDILPAAQVVVHGPRGDRLDEVQGITLEKSRRWVSNVIEVHNSGELRMSINPFTGSGEDPRLLGVRISSVGAGR